MTAHAFGLTSLENGRLFGRAVVCPEARYASINWRQQARIDRKFASAAMWKQIERELKDGWPNGLASRESTTFRLLTDALGGSASVQVITALPVEAPPHDTVRVLDELLKTFPTV